MPGGVIPDQYESCDRLRCEFFATRGQKVDADRAVGTAIYKPEEHLIIVLLIAAEQHSAAGKRFRIRVLFRAFQFLQPSPLILLDPAMLIGLSQPTPPDLIKETERPRGMGLHQMDQTIASGFFPDVIGIGTGDPVFGTFPPHAQNLERIA